MGARKRRRRSSDGVQLNLAAMLDMAFQLLAFFIATFQPTSLEHQIALRLPPPMMAEPQAIEPDDGRLIRFDPPLRVELLANPDGSLEAVSLLHNGKLIRDLDAFEAAAQWSLKNCDPVAPIDEILLEVDSRLDLQSTLTVIERCLKLKSSDGKAVTKITPMAVFKK